LGLSLTRILSEQPKQGSIAVSRLHDAIRELPLYEDGTNIFPTESVDSLDAEESIHTEQSMPKHAANLSPTAHLKKRIW
jgi:hypothetical protein